MRTQEGTDMFEVYEGIDVEDFIRNFLLIDATLANSEGSLQAH